MPTEAAMEAVNHHRTRVQSQNQQKRRKMNQAATGIYYEMRKKSYAKFDLAQVRSDQFAVMQEFGAFEPFRARHSSKDCTPLETYML